MQDKIVRSVCFQKARVFALAAFTLHSRKSAGIDSRCPNLARTAADDFAPQPGSPRRKGLKTTDLSELKAASDRLAEDLWDVDEENLVSKFMQLRRRAKTQPSK